MKHKIEFKKGDIVTFKAYGVAIKAKVMEVNATNHLFKPDDRVFYRLSGIEAKKSKSLTSICTGKCIIESMYFEPH